MVRVEQRAKVVDRVFGGDVAAIRVGRQLHTFLEKAIVSLFDTPRSVSGCDGRIAAAP